MVKSIGSRYLYVCRNQRTGSVFATTNLVTLGDRCDIQYGILRGIFSRDHKDFYRDDIYEIWKMDTDNIYLGKPRGSGFHKDYVSR